MSIDEVTFSILAVFAIVATLAIYYTPKTYAFFWRDISQVFETDRRPPKYTLHNVSFYRPTSFKRWNADRYYVGEFAIFDVEVDAEGIWLRNESPGGRKCAPYMLIPWGRFSFDMQDESHCHFTIFANHAWKVLVPNAAGELLVKPRP